MEHFLEHLARYPLRALGTGRRSSSPDREWAEAPRVKRASSKGTPPLGLSLLCGSGTPPPQRAGPICAGSKPPEGDQVRARDLVPGPCQISDDDVLAAQSCTASGFRRSVTSSRQARSSRRPRVIVCPRAESETRVPPRGGTPWTRAGPPGQVIPARRDVAAPSVTGCGCSSARRACGCAVA